MKTVVQSTVVAAAILFFAWCGVWEVRTLLADHYKQQADAATDDPAVQSALQRMNRYRPDLDTGWDLLADRRLFSEPIEAKKLARHALELNPRGWQSWRLIGLADLQLGNSREAVTALNEGLKFDNAFQAHFELGSLAFLLGNNDRFWTEMHSALQMAPPEMVANVLGETLRVSRGNYPDLSTLLKGQPPRKILLATDFFVDHSMLPDAVAAWRFASCPDYLASDCRYTLRYLLDHLVWTAVSGPIETAGSLSTEAQSIWNQSARTGILKAQKEDPGQIQDGNFLRPWFLSGFSWAPTAPSGIVLTPSPSRGGPNNDGMVSVVFSGNQPEHASLFHQYVLVQPGRRYELRFLTRGSGASSPSGITAVISDGKNNLDVIPVIIDRDWHENTGNFTVPPGKTIIYLGFQYDRPNGQTRMQGKAAFAEVSMSRIAGEQQ